MDAPDGSTIVLGSATIALLLKEGFAWLRSRNQKTTITPDPLNVNKTKDYVTVGECKTKMCEMGARVDRVADGQQKILDKLDEMDSRSERRAKETHDRIDPLVKELAKNIGQVELIKESFLKSTVGGRK